MTINAVDITMKVGAGGILEHPPVVSNDAYWDSIYDAALPSLTGAVWVATTGNDTTGTGTESLPYATIDKAVGDITAGGQVIVKDGTYTDVTGMRINDNNFSIPSGTSRINRTVIRAENRFGVRIKFTAGFSYLNNMIRFTTTNYMWVDGIIFEAIGGSAMSHMNFLLASENIVTRCIMKQDEHDTFGGFITMGDTGQYNLLQDVHCVGGARYGIQSGPGTTVTGGRNILRRCVVRQDFSDTNQPLAPFAHYGNNSGAGSLGSKWQNCIAVDGPYIHTGQGTYSYKWGSWYNPKGARFNNLTGCISLNEGVYYAGMYPNDNINTPDSTLDDCIIWDINSENAGADGLRAATGTCAADNMTIGNVPDQFHTGLVTVTNSYESDTNPSYLIKPNTVNVGAEVLNAFGAFLSVWGETDHDAITTDRLWPYPYESYIKAVFSEQLDAPVGATPATNVSARGFCTGNNLSGEAQSLSKYIGEYTGTEITNWDDLY